MARAKKVAAPAAAKPKRTRAPRAKPVAPADTREGLIAEMAKVLDGVDQVLPRLRHIDWPYPYSNELRTAIGQANELLKRMVPLLDPDGSETPQDVFSDALATAPGTAPTPARRGHFVEWFGYVPVLCIWGGFLQRQVTLHAVDPKEMWLNDTGFISPQCNLARDELNLRHWLRSRLEHTALAKGFKLKVLKSGQTAALERLSKEAWLRDVLAKGPVDPVPLPSTLAAVQLEPFI